MNGKPENLTDAMRVGKEEKRDAESEDEHVAERDIAAECQNNRAHKADDPHRIGEVSKWGVVVGVLEMASHAEMPAPADEVSRRSCEKGKERNPCGAVWAKKLHA